MTNDRLSAEELERKQLLLDDRIAESSPAITDLYLNLKRLRKGVRDGSMTSCSEDEFFESLKEVTSSV